MRKLFSYMWLLVMFAVASCTNDDGSESGIPDTISFQLEWMSSTAPAPDRCVTFPPIGYLGMINEARPQFFDGTTGSGTMGTPLLYCQPAEKYANEFRVFACQRADSGDNEPDGIHQFDVSLDLSEGTVLSDGYYATQGVLRQCQATHVLRYIRAPS